MAPIGTLVLATRCPFHNRLICSCMLFPFYRHGGRGSGAFDLSHALRMLAL